MGMPERAAYHAEIARSLGFAKQGLREDCLAPIGYIYKVAKTAHGEQKRKYSNRPYIVHPVRVALRVAAVYPDGGAIEAALLHDVVEDTDMTLADLYAVDGIDPATVRLVEMLTDTSKPGDGNRKTRKALDREHTARANTVGKLVKLADLIDNTLSIRANDPNFAKTYLREKRLILMEAIPALPKVTSKAERAYMNLWTIAMMLTW